MRAVRHYHQWAAAGTGRDNSGYRRYGAADVVLLIRMGRARRRSRSQRRSEPDRRRVTQSPPPRPRSRVGRRPRPRSRVFSATQATQGLPRNPATMRSCSSTSSPERRYREALVVGDVLLSRRGGRGRGVRRPARGRGRASPEYAGGAGRPGLDEQELSPRPSLDDEALRRTGNEVGDRCVDRDAPAGNAIPVWPVGTNATRRRTARPGQAPARPSSSRSRSRSRPSGRSSPAPRGSRRSAR